MGSKKREKPKHLGRGLQSLLGPIISSSSEGDQVSADSAMPAKFPPDEELRSSMREIRLDSISPNPYQPRRVWERTSNPLRAPFRSSWGPSEVRKVPGLWLPP